MTGDVAGFTPENEVQGSTRSRIRCIILCVTLLTLVGLIIVVAIAFTYATDPPGLLVHPDEVMILDESFGKGSGSQHYVDAMNEFVSNYDNAPLTQNIVECSFGNDPKSGEECVFRRLWLGGRCHEEDGWGYSQRQPCFLLTFNEPKDWVPEPYTSPDELPEEMPTSLRTYIQSRFTHNYPTQFLWVSCTGEYPADTEYMGEVMLYPWPGFPVYYFPVRHATNPHSVPMLALHLLEPHRNILIGITCHFWAKNLKPPHIATRLELLIE